MYKRLISLFNRSTAFAILKFSLYFQERIPFLRAFVRLSNKKANRKAERDIFNLHFPSCIGLGPGIDKDGKYYNSLGDHGFGYIEIGPVSISNVKTIIKHIQNKTPDHITALCINKDHEKCFSLSYDFADFFVLEIPTDDCIGVIDKILDTRLTYETYKPVLLRITHKLSKEKLDEILNYSLMNGVDGFVLAGVELIKVVNEYCKGRKTIIGYGGIRTAQAASEMIEAGADLIEITTGLLLDGPGLANRIIKEL